METEELGVFDDLKVRLDALETLLDMYGDWSPFAEKTDISIMEA